MDFGFLQELVYLNGGVFFTLSLRITPQVPHVVLPVVLTVALVYVVAL